MPTKKPATKKSAVKRPARAAAVSPKAMDADQSRLMALAWVFAGLCVLFAIMVYYRYA